MSMFGFDSYKAWKKIFGEGDLRTVDLPGDLRVVDLRTGDLPGDLVLRGIFIYIYKNLI